LCGEVHGAPGPKPIRSINLRPGIPLLALAPGPLDDDDAADLGTAVDRAVDALPWGIVIDLSGTDGVSAAGMAMLARAAVRAGQGDVGLCVVGSDRVQSAIAGAGLSELFDLHASRSEALSALGVRQ
jgi:anti-anti-sigma regulatory factor